MKHNKKFMMKLPRQSEANQNPMLIQLKALDIEKARVEKWNGTVPNWLMGDGGNQPFIFQLPANPTK